MKSSGRSYLRTAIVIAVLGAPVVSPHGLAGPDERYRADLLLIVAHPDDETAVGGQLAQMIFDGGTRVAVVYCNRGTGGGNNHGTEQAKAMGLMREIEARKALAAFGISNSWFLNGTDTPGQDVFRSLQNWNHGAVLEDVVRIVRLTRPAVILTWLPQVVAGENHGDHQASGVIATEAFDLAGDPTAFPAQVTPAREVTDIDNATDGLEPWQPKKLYFFSDATKPVVAEGPPFDLSAVSPARGQSYARLAAELHLPHLTQGDVSDVGLESVKTGEYARFIAWLSRYRLIFGKSVVSCSATGEVFEGTSGPPAEFVRPRGYIPELRTGISIALGGPYSFYRAFWPAHNIERIAKLATSGLEVTAGSYLFVPLELSNGTSNEVEVTLSAAAPDGWQVSGEGTYRIPARSEMQVQTFARTAAQTTDRPVRLLWKLRGADAIAGEVAMDVTLTEWSLPQ